MIVKFRFVLTALFLSLAMLPTAATKAAPPTVGSCQVFPADNPWNTDISGAAVASNSQDILDNIAAHGGDTLFPDFGSDPQYYFRWTAVPGTQKKVPVTFRVTGYGDESDPGPYPFPPNAPVEPGGDRHVIVVDTDNCILYETFNSAYVGGAQQGWLADSGAIYNLDSNANRPDGWTSADAAGLPIFPGLARCDEAESGTINHALRATFGHTRNTYIYPATHAAGSNDVTAPPMGLRLRLRSDYPEAGFTGQGLAIVHALKNYGLIVADNGSNWFISGELSSCWNMNQINKLKTIPGEDFDVIVSPPPPSGIVPASPSLYLPLNHAEVSGTAPQLGWNTVTGAKGDTPSTVVNYKIYLDQNPNPTTLIGTVKSTQLTQFTPTVPLISGFTYYWRVEAVVPNPNGAGTVTTASPVRDFVAASPINAAPTRTLYNSNRPTLTWNAVSGATHYHIQVANNSAFTGTLKVDDNTIVAPQLSYSLSALQSLTDGTWYWRVQAQSGSGIWGPYSPVETFIVDA